MNKMFLKKILLFTLIFSLLSFGLTGCFNNDDSIPWETCDTSDVIIHLTSTESGHHYNIYMDNKIKHSDVTVGNYYIYDVSLDKNHVFEVIHHKGTSFGAVDQSVYIANCEEHVYFTVTF